MSTLTQEPYGFTWGPVQVTRTAVIRGSHCVTLVTAAGRSLDIAVSPKGRTVRLWLDGEPMVLLGDS